MLWDMAGVSAFEFMRYLGDSIVRCLVDKYIGVGGSKGVTLKSKAPLI